MLNPHQVMRTVQVRIDRIPGSLADQTPEDKFLPNP
jgi:hypothetical protein